MASSQRLSTCCARGVGLQQGVVDDRGQRLPVGEGLGGKGGRIKGAVIKFQIRLARSGIGTAMVMLLVRGQLKPFSTAGSPRSLREMSIVLAGTGAKWWIRTHGLTSCGGV